MWCFLWSFDRMWTISRAESYDLYWSSSGVKPICTPPFDGGKRKIALAKLRKHPVSVHICAKTTCMYINGLLIHHVELAQQPWCMTWRPSSISTQWARCSERSIPKISFSMNLRAQKNDSMHHIAIMTFALFLPGRDHSCHTIGYLTY